MGYPRKHAYFSAFSLIPARTCVSGLWLCARFLAALTHQVYRRVPGQSPAESMFTCSLACVAHGSCDCGSPLIALLMALQLWFFTACVAHGSATVVLHCCCVLMALQLWFSIACVAHGSCKCGSPHICGVSLHPKDMKLSQQTR